MTDTLRIKRRASGGGAGAPASLANAELAYNEASDLLYYGWGTGGAGGTATTMLPIGGPGMAATALPVMNTGTIGNAGTLAFWSKGDHIHPSDTSRAPTASPVITGTASFVNITASGSLSAANINSTPIGATTPSTGAFTTLSATGAVTGAGFNVFATVAAPTFTGDAKAVTAAVGDEDTSIATTLFNARLSGGFTAFNGGDANVTLTALQMGYRYVRFTGALTGARTYTLPATTQRNWVVENLTTGGFDITFSIGTGVAVVVLPMNMRTEIYTDGLNSVGSTQNLLSGNTLRVGDTGSNSLVVKVGAATTNATTLDVAGTGVLQVLVNPLFSAGLNFGSAYAPGGNADVSRHLALYGTVNGISVTPSRINYNTGPSIEHWFLFNGTDVAQISATGINKAAIGATSPSTGAFTTLSASGAVTGAGFVGVFAPLASPVFTGDPRAVTVANTDSDTSIATTAFVHSVRQDQFAPPGADVAWNSFKITGLADPGSPQDAATKNYVDLTAQGLVAKQPVRCATTTNLAALSGLLTVDGQTVAANDRVLVKDQTLSQNNGIYLAASGAWSRALDMSIWAEVPAAFVFVVSGATNADNGYVCTSDAGGTLGTTPITWAQFSGAGQVVAGAGLTKSGNQLDVGGTLNRIAVLTDSIDIDAAYVGQASITTLGTIATGTWNATTLLVGKGGTGATTLTGYVKGAGTLALTASTTIPNTDIAGLGTMSTQFANNVTISGGTIDNITFDMGSF